MIDQDISFDNLFQSALDIYVKKTELVAVDLNIVYRIPGK